MMRRSPAISGASRRGMSLLEVFVALAIFIAALAVITQIISTGSRASARAQFQSEATLRAESTMAEAVAGIIPMQNDKKAFDDDAAWQWSLAVETGPHVDTLLLTVTTEHTTETGRVNGMATLKRIIRDPQLFLNAASATTNSSAMDLLNEASNSSAP
jgi:type II secretory pathway pseudopilin PulG